jgi:hypothetical protein
LKAQFRQLLQEGQRDVVLDFSFWNREYRDEWRDIVSEERRMDGAGEEEGRGKYRVILVFFDARKRFFGGGLRGGE